MASRVRTEWVLPASMLLGTFAWSFVYVSLPFHIQKISTLDEVSTLRWTGWILGISPLATVVTAPWLGRIGGRRNPKTAFEIIQYLQGAAFFAMAMARTLPESVGASEELITGAYQSVAEAKRDGGNRVGVL